MEQRIAELERKLLDAELRIGELEALNDEYSNLLGLRLRPWTVEEMEALDGAGMRQEEWDGVSKREWRF